MMKKLVLNTLINFIVFFFLFTILRMIIEKEDSFATTIIISFLTSIAYVLFLSLHQRIKNKQKKTIKKHFKVLKLNIKKASFD